MRLEVLFGDKVPSLNSSDSQISNYIKIKYPHIDKNIHLFERRVEAFYKKESSISAFDLLRQSGGHPAMMNNSLFKVYQKAVSFEFQKNFISHLKRRLLRAVLLQERSSEGYKALSQGSIQNKYLKQVLLSRYEEFFKHIESFDRPLADMEVRNVSDNEKPLLDYVLLRTVLNERVSRNISTKSTLQIALYDQYYSLSVKSLGRNAGDFFYFLTRRESKTLKQFLFYEMESVHNLLTIYVLTR